MEKEFFEGLESFMKNISDWIPSEDTVFNLLKAEGEVQSLKAQIERSYSTLGKEAEKLYGLDNLGSTGKTLKDLQEKLKEAEAALDALKAKSEKNFRQNTADTAQQNTVDHSETDSQSSNCPDATQTETTKNIFCTSCGNKITPGDCFCGRCGTKLR